MERTPNFFRYPAISADHPAVEASVGDAWERMEYRPNAVAVLKNLDEEVLVVKPFKDPSAWIFPQGGIDRNESAEDGLRRELFEELGMQPENITDLTHLGTADMDAETDRADKRGFTKGKRFISYSVTYSGSKELRVDPQEIIEYRWILSRDVSTTLKTSRQEKTELLQRIFKQAGS